MLQGIPEYSSPVQQPILNPRTPDVWSTTWQTLTGTKAADPDAIAVGNNWNCHFIGVQTPLHPSSPKLNPPQLSRFPNFVADVLPYKLGSRFKLASNNEYADHPTTPSSVVHSRPSTAYSIFRRHGLKPKSGEVKILNLGAHQGSALPKQAKSHPGAASLLLLSKTFGAMHTTICRMLIARCSLLVHKCFSQQVQLGPGRLAVKRRLERLMAFV